MTREGDAIGLKIALLYGAPLLAAAISIAVYVAGSEGWVLLEWYTAMLFPLNALIGIAGAAGSGVIGRDSPASRFRGAVDCGFFGLILHTVGLVAVAYLANWLGASI